MTIQPGTRWTHNRDGYAVVVEDIPYDAVKVKSAGDANWHPAVCYSVATDEDTTLFVRSEADFLAKFTASMRDEGDA